MKLREYADLIGVSYKTAWRYFHAGELDAYQTSTGTIIVRDVVEPAVIVQEKTEGVGLSVPQEVWVRQQASFEKVSSEEIVRRAVDWYMRTYPSLVCQERVFDLNGANSKASD